MIDVSDEHVKEFGDGVGEVVAPSFSAFCEKFRNDLLSGARLPLSSRVFSALIISSVAPRRSL